jgi:hypothetical protein
MNREQQLAATGHVPQSPRQSHAAELRVGDIDVEVPRRSDHGRAQSLSQVTRDCPKMTAWHHELSS